MSRNELLNKYQAERTPCETFLRVMGYIRNKNSFNTGKQSEAAQRVYFTESCACSK
jgi:anaerobic ribonucleoside-triphosphate reductase